MADLQKLVHGEPEWDVKVNAIIDNMNNIGDMMWTQGMTTGLVFQNGFNQLGSDESHQTIYRYVQFKGWKLVDLQIMVALSAAPSSTSNVTAVSLPDSISYDGWHEWAESDGYQLAINGNQFRISVLGTNKWWVGDGSHYVAHIFYLHIDQ